MKYAAYIPDFTTSCSEIEHPQHSCGEDDSSDTSTVLHFEVSGGDSDPLDCSSLQLDESRREDYSSKRLRLLVDVGGQAVAIFLTFGIVVAPMLAIGGSPVALISSAIAGAYLLICGLRID